MRIFVVFHTGQDLPTSIHSAHYSKWEAELVAENLNKTISCFWEHYEVQETSLYPEKE